MNPLCCFSGLFLCRGFWTLWVCILAPVASARLCCCAAATPTSQPAAALLVCGWMCWSLAEMGHLGGVGLCSSHIWSCCSPQNRPAAVQRSPHNGPPPPCMNPALTNTSWVREEGWDISRPFFSPVSLFYHHLLFMSCVILHVCLSLSFIRQIKLYCCHL